MKSHEQVSFDIEQAVNAASFRRRHLRLVDVVQPPQETEWFDAMEFVPAHKGKYKVGFEWNGHMEQYNGVFMFWTGVRWLHTALEASLFPQPGDFFRGLKEQQPEPEHH